MASELETTNSASTNTTTTSSSSSNNNKENITIVQTSSNNNNKTLINSTSIDKLTEIKNNAKHLVIDNKNIVDNNNNVENGDDKNERLNDDDEEEEEDGEWEIVGSNKSKSKTNQQQQQQTQFSRSSRNRRRRRNSKSLSTTTITVKSAKQTNNNTKSETNKANQANNDSSSSTSSNVSVKDDKQNATSSTNELTKPVTTTTNPWAKVPAVKPVSISSSSSSTVIKNEILLDNSVNNSINSSITTPVITTTTTTTTTTITSKNTTHNSNNQHHVQPQISKQNSNLDTFDWPSLASNNESIKKTTLPQSQSCTFNNNTSSKLSSSSSSAVLNEHTTTTNNNIKTRKLKSCSTYSITDKNNEQENEHEEEQQEETGNKSSNDLNEQNTTSKTTAKQIKWKPLMIDTPKRERKPYRGGNNGGSRSYRQQQQASSSDLSTNNQFYTEENLIPPHYQSIKGQKNMNNNNTNNSSNRARSLDRQDQQSNDDTTVQTNLDDSSNNNNNKASKINSLTKSKLNRSFNESTSNHQRNNTNHHQTKLNSSDSLNNSNNNNNNNSRPFKFDRATAAAKAYRTSLNPSLLINSNNLSTNRANNTNNKSNISNNKRENHKEYLYGEDAIIVEEVPIILSVAPNGIYCTTVATTNNTNPTHNNTDNYLPGMILPNTTNNILDSHGSLMVTPYLMNQNQQNMILANTTNTSNSIDIIANNNNPVGNSMFFNTIYTEEEQIKECVRHQIEYYFSNENLEHDLFLRKKMDTNGYIPLSVIASFNRVKSLSQDFQLIVNAIKMSDSIELLKQNFTDDNNENKQDFLVRCKINPTKWPLDNNNSLSQLNPNVAEFIPRFTTAPTLQQQPPSTKENIPAEQTKKSSQPVEMLNRNDKSGLENLYNLDRYMLSTSAPEREPIEWLKVQSKKEKSILKKQKKLQQSNTTTTTTPTPPTTTIITKNNNSKKQKSQLSPPTSTTNNNSKLSKTSDNRVEIDFMFDEEINNKTNTANNNYDSSSDSDLDYDDNYDYDEMNDEAISKLVIITQTPPTAANRKNTSHTLHLNDRTGDHIPRAKIIAELAKTINDGLFYYEQNLNNKHQRSTSSSSGFNKTIDLISHDEFKKLKQNSKHFSSASSDTSSSKDIYIPNTATSTTVTSNNNVKDYSKVVQSNGISIKSSVNNNNNNTNKSSQFVPHSLPNDTPSFRQLMSHVNSLKSGTSSKTKYNQTNNNSQNRDNSVSKERTLLTKKRDLTSSKMSHFYPVIKEAKPAAPGAPQKKRTRDSDNPPIESHVGWVIDNSVTNNNKQRDSSKQSSTTTSTRFRMNSASCNGFSSGTTPVEEFINNNLSSSYLQGQDLQPFQHPSYTLLQQNGFTQQLYGKFRKRCLTGKLNYLI